MQLSVIAIDLQNAKHDDHIKCTFNFWSDSGNEIIRHKHIKCSMELDHKHTNSVHVNNYKHGDSVKLFEIIKLNIVRICTSGIMHKNGSINSTIIHLYL
jgi:hypothetical protein